jgi:hypothetical protein
MPFERVRGNPLSRLEQLLVPLCKELLDDIALLTLGLLALLDIAQPAQQIPQPLSTVLAPFSKERDGFFELPEPLADVCVICGDGESPAFGFAVEFGEEARGLWMVSRGRFCRLDEFLKVDAVLAVPW